MKSNSILQLFIRYISLNILGQIAFSCYTLADTFFVSAKLGSDGLTALNLAFPIFCFMNGIGLMIAIGAGTRYSLAKSRGNKERANLIYTQACYLALVISGIFMTIGLWWSQPLVTLLGANSEVFDITHTYLKVMLLFAPAFMMNNLLHSFVRNDGYPSLSMCAMIIGSVSNIILDYIFIFPCNMGIFGAIFATGIAPLISISILILVFILRKNNFHFKLHLPEVGDVLTIITTGIPPFLTEATSGIVMFLFNMIILKISGNLGVAVFGIVSVISLVVIAIYTGLSQGVQPLISQYYGLRQKYAIDKLIQYSLLTAVALSIVLYLILFINADLFVSVFNSERDVILQSNAIIALRLYFIACPFIGINIMSATICSCTEHIRLAQIITILRGIVVLIPMAFIMAFLFELNGVWSAYPLSECIVALISVNLLVKVKRNINF